MWELIKNVLEGGMVAVPVAMVIVDFILRRQANVRAVNHLCGVPGRLVVRPPFGESLTNYAARTPAAGFCPSLAKRAAQPRW